jgi:Ni,Fe-hydrogenase III component G
MAYATSKGHGPLGRRLFLPKDWAEDLPRRKECRVPEEIEHRTKWPKVWPGRRIGRP